MDPYGITLIVTALITGVSSSGAVKDSYNTLKKLIQHKFEDVSDFKLVLANYEEEPEVWKAPLKYELEKVHADEDEEIVQVAQKVMDLVKPEQQSTRERIVATTDTTTKLLDQVYQLSLSEANRWIRFSLAATILGLPIITVGVIEVFFGNISLGLISTASGIIIEALAVLFYAQQRSSMQRVDNIRERLIEAEKVRLAIDLASATNLETQNELQKAIQNRADQLSIEIEKSLSRK